MATVHKGLFSDLRYISDLRQTSEKQLRNTCMHNSDFLIFRKNCSQQYMPQFKFFELFFSKDNSERYPDSFFTQICRVTSTIIRLPAKINKSVALYEMFFARAKLHRQFPRALSFRLLRPYEHSQGVWLNGFHIEEGLCSQRLWFQTIWRTFDIVLTYQFSVFSLFCFSDRSLSRILRARSSISLHPRDKHQRNLENNTQHLVCFVYFVCF